MNITRIILPAVTAACLCACAPREAAPAPMKDNRAGVEALAKYRDTPEVKHLLLVSCTEGSNADAYIYEKDDSTSTWTMTLHTPAYIGRDGLIDAESKRESDGCSPIGDFGFITAFGIKPDPGTAFEYVHVTPDIYAIDTDNEYYNLIVDASAPGIPREGEHMWECTPDYNYGLSSDYNAERAPGRGSNIFLHCMGAKPSTGGCVAVPEEVMKQILLTFQPADRMVIYPARVPK